MTNTTIYVTHLARALDASGLKWDGPALARHLNVLNLGHRYGHYRPGGRGIYKMISCLAVAYEKQGRDNDAAAIARAFASKDGSYLWR